jgi:hypothetical protein
LLRVLKYLGIFALVGIVLATGAGVYAYLH